MSSSLEPLPTDLERLFAAERRAYVEDVAMKASVLAKVELAAALAAPAISELGAPPGGSIVRAGLSAKAVGWVAAGAFALGVVAGAGVTRVAPREAPPPAVPSTPAVDRSPAPVLGAPILPATDAGVPEVATPVATDAGASSTIVIRQRSTNSDLTRERELLDVARAALASANVDLALRSVEQHAKTWPKGQMREEREVLWVQALVAAHRQEEAARHASAFRRDFPDSIQLPTVEAAVGGSAPR